VGGVDGIVEDEQQLPVGHPFPPQVRSGVETDGDLLRGDPIGLQQDREGRGRFMAPCPPYWAGTCRSVPACSAPRCRSPMWPGKQSPAWR
jgi:hypothetical protein